MSDWWSMGGYGAYVWSSFGIAAVVLVWNMLWPYVQLRQLRRRLRQQEEQV